MQRRKKERKENWKQIRGDRDKDIVKEDMRKNSITRNEKEQKRKVKRGEGKGRNGRGIVARYMYLLIIPQLFYMIWLH